MAPKFQQFYLPKRNQKTFNFWNIYDVLQHLDSNKLEFVSFRLQAGASGTTWGQGYIG